MKIHREGYASLVLVLIFLLLVNIGLYYINTNKYLHLFLGLASFGFFLFILNFFRNPIRNASINDNHVIAPSDGKLVVIEEVYESEILKTNCIQLSIFMSPLNVHKQWYPINGTVSYSKYHPGKYLVAWHPKSSTENERTTIVIDGKNNTRILYRQIAGAVARRICNYAKENTEVNQSKEAGFIKFGSRVDVFVPKDSKINVKIGDTIIGCKTILAHLN
ncbi:MAG: phosphatidylserine decarboxylase family protein [Crocinitomicaceae bacterium]|nr:phosphatidylserine decarboxylase family protein [Crocinitomicaceae bacterium]|tara:strand:+ start:12576 stop:13232 length:657 start_codon:yes stop_codon:yes gene_type:complete